MASYFFAKIATYIMEESKNNKKEQFIMGIMRLAETTYVPRLSRGYLDSMIEEFINSGNKCMEVQFENYQSIHAARTTLDAAIKRSNRGVKTQQNNGKLYIVRVY